jgi:hypothetical protein
MGLVTHIQFDREDLSEKITKTISMTTTTTTTVNAEWQTEAEPAEKSLTSQLDGLSINNRQRSSLPNSILICDAGYGFPREKRPFQEKMNAIASQLSNFIRWQTTSKRIDDQSVAMVRVVGCADETTRAALQAKLVEKLDMHVLPNHVTISCELLEECLWKEPNKSTHADEEAVVYLSPDADAALDPCKRPPRVVVVGLLIDRRVQPNRSKDRASKLNMVAKRWPLEDCFLEISAKEPLNVDCVLEGMQQWWWNSEDASAKVDRESFIKAASQAIDHHAKRHPSRPLHVTSRQPVCSSDIF